MPKYMAVFILLVAAIFGATACSGGISTTPQTTPPTSTPSTTATPTITPSQTPTLNQYELEYVLFAAYPDYFWCDPDLYPVARPGSEQANAITQFPTVQANQTEFSTILTYLNLTVKTDYADAEKLNIYREYKRLNGAITMTPANGPGGYTFSLRSGDNQGLHIEGAITADGTITVTLEESSFNT